MSKTRKFYVQGYPVLIDEADWEIVADYPYAWQIKKHGRTHYVAATDTSLGFHARKFTRLHRLLTGAADHEVVDHINGSGLDNRRENLRVGNQFENSQNRRKNKNNKSGFTGVSFFRRHQNWKAYLSYHYKRYHLGTFKTKEEAALAYNEGVLRILPPEHSKLRKLNVVEGNHETKKVA